MPLPPPRSSEALSTDSAADEAAKIDGVEKIITVDNAAYEKVGSTRSKSCSINNDN